MSHCTLNRSEIPNSLVQERSSESLVAEAKQGNELALIELWNRYRRSVRVAIWRIINNDDDIEDLLQETYLKCHLHIGQFDGRSRFSTWLIRIATNSALMVHRKRRVRRELLIGNAEEDALMFLDTFRDHSEDIEARYIRQERCGRLHAALLRLRPSTRRIIELRHDLGLSLKDIAAIDGVTVCATKSRLLRARIALRESLERADCGI